jgi:ribosomal protein L37AE/L43A
LTGKFGPRTQAIAIRQVRQWVEQLPPGDSICMRCESALPDKQFKVWKQWFKKHEDYRWEINDCHRSFFFYKPTVLQ